MKKHSNEHVKTCGSCPRIYINSSVTLDKIKPGQSARVCAVTARQPMRRRLLDLGFSDGAKVKCVMKSPLGDPSAYLVRGTLIALRREDSGTVFVIK